MNFWRSKSPKGKGRAGTRTGRLQGAEVGVKDAPAPEARERIAARMNQKSRRCQQRVPVPRDTHVYYKLVAQDGAADRTRIYQGKMRDISLSGTQFVGPLDPALNPDLLLEREYLIGMNLCLAFAERQVKVLGQAVHVQPKPDEPGNYLFGIRFIDPSEELQTAIHNFLISLQMGGLKRIRM